ncbi:MAG: hypothetical protein WA139_05510 [Candidatus Aenigmatarchaeota archaeon]
METKLWLVAVFAVLAFSLTLLSPVIGSVWSTNREFNSTQDSVFLNYTNSYTQNITLWFNASQALMLNISNSSTTINANYSQSNTLSDCLYPSIRFISRNASNFAPATLINLTAAENSTKVNLTFSTLSCLPGRYWGGFLITNSTNATENITINVDIQIPISANNFNGLAQTGMANMTASMPGNASAFHRYYFNTSEVNRSTSVTINFTAAQDMDIFLFDNSTAAKLLAKSINKSNSSEWLTYSYLVPNSIYEIRIFGNITNASSTPYNFYIMFSTLNATNTTGTGQLSSIDFGNISVSGRNFTNITLRNEGNFTLNSVAESKEIYYVKRWETNISSDGLFLVPPFATRIRVAVNWTNVSQNYTIHLTAPNRTLISSSNGKFTIANFTNASMEEYVEIAENTKGYWNASVRNNTRESQSNYTITAYVWYPVSDWISTNYTTMTFNSTGNNNFTSFVNVSFIVPNNSIDGKYEGFLQYTSAAGAALRMPFNASVNASSLIVNETLNSATVELRENIGANMTKVLNITMNNSGSYNLSYVATNSTSALWSGTRYINFTYQIPATPISSGTNHMVNITLYVDPNTTANASGVYEGYIYFNATEARPYQGFTLTLRVNLSNDLNLSIVKIISQDNNKDTTFNWINFTNAAKQVMAKLNAYYINGTGEITSLNTSNFTTAWLTNANISYRIPTTGNLTIANYSATAADPIYCTNLPCPDGNAAGFYYINVTLPASQPGGIYQLHIGANYSRGDGYAFKGEGIYNYLYINQTGLYMAIETSPSSMSNATTALVNVSVKNYGPLAASAAKITLTKGSGMTINSITKRGDGCTDTSSDTATGDFTFTMGAHNGTGCVVTWNVTSGTTAVTAVSTINGTAKVWFNSLQFSTSVTVPSSSTTTSTTSSSSTTAAAANTTATATANASANLTITSFPTETRITQNASGNATVSVKNIGLTNFTGIKIYVDGISQSWYVQPAAQDIGAGVEKSYFITFNIPASAQPVSYPINYVANNTAATKSASATLLVIPSNQTAAQIVSNISEYVLKFNQLSLLINQTRVSGANLTEADALMNQTRALLEKANAYIKAGDYFNAYQQISQIDSLLKSAEAKITEAKQAMGNQSGGWLWIVVIVLVIGVAGFIAYLAMPPKHGFAPDAGYQYAHPGIMGKTKLDIVKKKARDIFEKIKDKLKRKRQPKPYAYSGPKSPPPFVYKGPSLE